MANPDPIDEINLPHRLRRLARQSADAIRERDLFGEKRLHIPSLLKHLGLRLHERDIAQVRGLIEDDEITLRASPTHINNRLVILHEIGHAIFLRDFPSLAAQLNARHHEEFATHFAVNVLLPEHKRTAFSHVFRELSSPSELVRAAQTFGFPIAMFLQVASWDGDAFAGNNNVWLRVKLSVNRYTGRDPKLRIVAAHFDPARWYLPSNKGISGIIGDSDWLLEIAIGQERRRDGVPIKIQKLVNDRSRKYTWVQSSATISVMALRPVAREQGAHLLVLATPAPS